MKKLWIALAVVLSAAALYAFVLPKGEQTSPEEVAIKWYTWDEAIALNAKNPKKIFIDLYTEWCGYCKKMDANTFKDPEVAKYMNEHFYAVKFDAEQHGDEFLFTPPADPVKRAANLIRIYGTSADFKEGYYTIDDAGNSRSFGVVNRSFFEDTNRTGKARFYKPQAPVQAMLTVPGSSRLISSSKLSNGKTAANHVAWLATVIPANKAVKCQCKQCCSN